MIGKASKVLLRKPSNYSLVRKFKKSLQKTEDPEIS